MILPGLTTATQYSGDPFPEPMRVSAGLTVTGLSGNIRTQIFPPRRTFRVIARRPASICLDVLQAGSSVGRADLPNQIRLPREDLPLSLPACGLRPLALAGLQLLAPSSTSVRQTSTREFRRRHLH